MTEKKRLDVLLFEKGLAPSRERAQRLIMAGSVYVNEQKSDKPGNQVPVDAKVEIRGSDIPFVSRGGLKLDKAVKRFGLNLSGAAAMDIGASTGGFTDCMLQNGAKKVYAVDVGYGQLAWKLRTDERVVNLERTNIRYVTPDQLGEPLDFASIDVSFISLKLVLPVLKELLKDGGEAVCLIKPQFEAGKGKVGKKGVVREPEIHLEVIEAVTAFARSLGFSLMHLDFSPVRGPEGNIEYLMHLKKDGLGECFDGCDAKALVEQSHKALQGGKAT